MAMIKNLQKTVRITLNGAAKLTKEVHQKRKTIRYINR